MAVYNKKESVELPFVYRIEALTKPDQNKRYNTPHLDSMRYMHRTVHSHIAIQEMSAVRHPLVFENCQIFYSGLRKHFRKYVCTRLFIAEVQTNV